MYGDSKGEREGGERSVEEERGRGRLVAGGGGGGGGGRGAAVGTDALLYRSPLCSRVISRWYISTANESPPVE